ncbi:MAG: YggS family pyridoxal phosphate-dependent enzyme [Candidatus Howiella sp.]|jgi:pyridoxal phosphate enzyme (YggS family)
MTERLSNNELAEKKRYFDENYADIITRAAAAAKKSGRRMEDITLLAATKTVPPEVMNYAFSKGIRYMGENRVQEFLSKYDDLRLEGVTRHFIGHLQTNKVRMIIDRVDMIESVDSLRLAACVGEQAARAGRVMDILLEVNIGKEESKSGFLPDEAETAVREIAQMRGVRVQGLMAIPPICDDKKVARKYFAQMRQLFIDIKAKNIDNSNMVCLSMGMSDDFDVAIEEGANLVRIGTALFGRRLYR